MIIITVQFIHLVIYVVTFTSFNCCPIIATVCLINEYEWMNECLYRLPAYPEAAMFCVVQPWRVLYIIDHLSSVHDLHWSLHGVQVPAALWTRHRQASHRHQNRRRLDRIVLHRRTIVRPVNARQSPVAASLQRYRCLICGFVKSN